jgi:hypothetical protein
LDANYFYFDGSFDLSFSFYEQNKKRRVMIMKDSKGNLFFENNLFRVTCLAKTWNESPGIRIQVKQPNGRLHFGPEISLEEVPDLLQFIQEALTTEQIFQDGE